MPRRDPTFTDNDLIRFFCKNLDPAEKERVLQAFSDYFTKKKPLCPNDPEQPKEEENRPCEWVKFLKDLIDIADMLAKLLEWVIAILVAIESALIIAGDLIYIWAWLRPFARLLEMLKVFIGYLITLLVYIAAVMKLISELGPFATMLEKIFCDGEKPESLPAPPSTNGLPPSPTPESTWIEDIQQLIHELNDFEIPPGP